MISKPKISLVSICLNHVGRSGTGSNISSGGCGWGIQQSEGTTEEINKVQYDDADAALETFEEESGNFPLLPISEDIMPAVSAATNAR